MAERDDIRNTLGGTEFGTSLKDLDDGDLSNGTYNAMTPDGRTRDNNHGVRSEYEDALEFNSDDDQIPWPSGPTRDDTDDAMGMLDRPGLNYRGMVRRN